MFKNMNEKNVGVGTFVEACVGANSIRPKKMNVAGISLISLIITIIVIIILAAIVIFTGLNTPDRANLAKFMQGISDFRLAVQQDFFNKKSKYAAEQRSLSNAQIYYVIANGGNDNIITDINVEPNKANEGTFGEGKIFTLEDLGLNNQNLNLTGEYFYKIDDDTYVSNWKKNTKYYAPTETHYISNTGEVIVVPGYRVEESDGTRWYVNEVASYVSNTPITGPNSPIVVASSVGVYSNSTYTEVPEDKTMTYNGTTNKVYVKFDVDSNDTNITSVKVKGTELIPISASNGVNTYVYEATSNGLIKASITANGNTSEKNITEVKCFNLIKISEANMKVGDSLNYPIDSNSITIPGEENGTGSNQAITNDGREMDWYVWKTANNNITIIPQSPVSATKLSHGAGWVNSVSILNRVCKELYWITG